MQPGQAALVLRGCLAVASPVGYFIAGWVGVIRVVVEVAL